MISDTDKKEFEWCCNMASLLAHATTSPVTSEVGGGLHTKLAQHVEAKWPGLTTTYRQFRAAGIKAKNDKMAKEGPLKWAELHVHTLMENPLIGAVEIGWLSKWGDGLTCGECKQFYQRYVVQFPPDFTNYFSWSVGMHNAVNVKLGKSVMSVDDAQKIWHLETK